MIPNVLQTIAKSVEARLKVRQAECSFKDLQVKAKACPLPKEFGKAFQGPGTHIISEIKFKSPAIGELAQANEKDAVQIAGEYLKAGTTAISILTEVDHFQGSYAYLKAVRKAYPDALLLMKDFVIDEYQILEARVNGADAILLIVSLLGAKKTARLLAFADQMDLSTLIEVHDEAELKVALELAPALIGVNNRDLKTLKISLETSAELAEFIPEDTVVISESGIKTREEILNLEALGYRGFLVGGSLMQSSKREEALKDLLGKNA